MSTSVFRQPFTAEGQSASVNTGAFQGYSIANNQLTACISHFALMAATTRLVLTPIGIRSQP
jgi:hypothetical protein